MTETALACFGPMHHSFSASYTNPWTPLTPRIWSRCCTAWGFDVQIAVLKPLT